MYVQFPEPTLAELLDDPMVRLVMASDGVKDTALRGLIRTVLQARRTGRDDEFGRVGPSHGGPLRRFISPPRSWRAIP